MAEQAHLHGPSLRLVEGRQRGTGVVLKVPRAPDAPVGARALRADRPAESHDDAWAPEPEPAAA